MAARDIGAGLRRAGLRPPRHAEGFPEVVAAFRKEGGNYLRDAYDARRHPDSGLYEIPFFLNRAGTVAFTIQDDQGEVEFASEIDAPAGSGLLKFSQFTPQSEEVFTLRLRTDGGEYSLPLRLH